MSIAHKAIETVLHPLKFRSAEVRRVEAVTPLMRRVILAGDELSDFVTLAPGDHVKLLFPSPGADRPVVPTAGPNGFVYPEDVGNPVLRDYTPRRFDPVYRELTIDFVLHGDGPGATWAAAAKPGGHIAVVGPRGSHVLAAEMTWHELVGDETALPSISRRIEELPAGAKAIAVVEIANRNEEQQVESDADVDWLWVHRNGVQPGANDLLEQAVRSLIFPTGEFFTYLSGEASTIKPIRRHLLRERGARIELSEITGHWKRTVPDWAPHAPIND